MSEYIQGLLFSRCGRIAGVIAKRSADQKWDFFQMSDTRATYPTLVGCVPQISGKSFGIARFATFYMPF